jgi:2-methylisocitrate lyase-like PEP mutase family enzyme
MSIDRATQFHRLDEDGTFILPDAWDAASAAVLAAAGATAIATTSSAISWALGVPDGEQAERDGVVAAVARMARAVDVPLTAHVAVGAPLRPVEEQCARLAAAREAADRRTRAFVLNARTDVFLASVGEPEAREAMVLERAERYRAAGADCLFVPGVTDLATIQRLVSRAADR